MDFTPLIKSAIQLWYLIPLFLLISLVKSAWFKGIFGEFMVNLLARFRLDNDVYHLIKNVTLATEDGSTQIDHIFVSVYGVFVVETKNMRGWIFGNAGQKLWTQQIYKQKFKFQNPLHQNYKHTKILQQFIGLEDEQIFSVIVFVGDSQFKNDLPDNVTYTKGYIDYILSKDTPVLSAETCRQVINKIKSQRLQPRLTTQRNHVKHVKDIIAAKRNSEMNCPACGNPMRQRQTRRGKHHGKPFWGCSQFPRCKQIIPINLTD